MPNPRPLIDQATHAQAVFCAAQIALYAADERRATERTKEVRRDRVLAWNAYVEAKANLREACDALEFATDED